jgi:hypothetical protein
MATAVPPTQPKLTFVIPDIVRTFLPLLISKVPSTIVIGGRAVPVHDTILKVVADGVIDQADLFVLVAAFLAAPPATPRVPVTGMSPVVPSPTPLPTPFPTPVPPFTPPVLLPFPTPTTPPVSLLWPTSLTLDLDLYLPENVSCPFRYEELPDHYDIIKTDGTTNLPIHGGAYLHAGYRDAQGVPINFEQRGTPYLYNTAIWTARVISSPNPARVGMTDSIKSVNGATERTSNNVANFRADEYTRTGGMDVPVHFPPDCNEEVIEIGLEVMAPLGLVTTKPVRFPKIS